MKIAFINSLSETFGSTVRCRLILRCLIELGHEVHYSEASPSSLQNAILIEQTDSVSGYIIAIKKRLNFIKKHSPFDLIIISKLNPLTVPLIIQSKLSKIPFIVDWDDMDSFFQTSEFRTLSSRTVERAFPALIDVITTHNDEIMNFAKRRGAKKLFFLHQAYDNLLFDPTHYDRKRERRRLMLSEKETAVVVTLTLTEGGARDMELLLNTMELLEDKQSLITLMIAGDGPQKFKYQELARKKKLHNLRWLGWVPYNDIPRILSAADLGLIFMKKDKGNLFRFSLKLVEYIGFGLPVIGSLTGATQKELSGYLDEEVPPSADALGMAILNWQRKNSMHKNNSNAIGNGINKQLFDRKFGIGNMKTILKGILDSL